MATVAEVCTEALRRLAFDVPTSFYGSTDPTAAQVLTLLQEEGRKLMRRAAWTKLQHEYLFSTVTSTAGYGLPVDFDRFIHRTHWDRTNHWELMGPISPSEWQLIKSGIITSFPRRRFRVSGNTTTAFTVDPTPSSTGDTLVFEYISNGWVTAPDWITGTAYAAGSDASYNGQYYTTTLGGTSGATAPTHTSGSVNDGGVTWTFAGYGRSKVMDDDDVIVLDDELVTLGLQWRFLDAKGLDYSAKLSDYNEEVGKAIARDGGARTLLLAGQPGRRFLSPWNIPDGNYG